MKSVIFGMFAETSVHPGAESTGDIIDLPVAKEAVTNYPFLPGSSLKGSLRSKARGLLNDSEVGELFGKQDNAGGFATTDARLLLLPIRSLTSHFVWVTCPYILERLARDLDLVGTPLSLSIEPLGENQVYSKGGGKLYLEELILQAEAKPDYVESVANAIKPLIRHQSVRDSLANQLVIVSNDWMNHFASYCLPVRARNQLNEKTKASENLWYEQTLSPDTLLYFAILQRPDRPGDVGKIASLLVENPYIQVGGNETMGQGWCVTSRYGEEVR